MTEDIKIFGAPLNGLLHVAAGLEAIGLTHQPTDVPPGGVERATERLRARVVELHRELSTMAASWAWDGAEGIEGVEPLTYGDEDDEGEDWKE